MTAKTLQDASVLAAVLGGQADRLALYFALRDQATKLECHELMEVAYGATERQNAMDAWVTWVTLCQQLAALGDGVFADKLRAAVHRKRETLECVAHELYPEQYDQLNPGQARTFYMEQIAVAVPEYRATLAAAYTTGCNDEIVVDSERAAFWHAVSGSSMP